MQKSVTDGEITVTVEEAERISKQFSEMQSTAALAGEFLQRKKADIVKMFVRTESETAADVFIKALSKLSPEELFKLYSEGKSLTEKAEVQLSGSVIKQSDKNSYFIV